MFDFHQLIIVFYPLSNQFLSEIIGFPQDNFGGVSNFITRFSILQSGMWLGQNGFQGKN
jgi:hypothetical protein